MTILLEEPDALRFAHALHDADELRMSAPSWLEAAQVAGRLTGGLHAAGWALPGSGEGRGLQLAREDVGRHNALDKVLGAVVRSGRVPAAGYLLTTSRASFELVQKGLALGAADYITKPISPPIVLARVKTQLENKAMADFLRDQAAFLQAEVARQTQMVRAVQDATVLAMASLAETRDSDTGNHIRRTQFYVQALANKLKTHPRFSAFLTDEMIELLFKTAPLHDIGKVGIPDRILLKPGRFTPEEFEIMKTHTSLGRAAIEHAEAALGVPVEFLQVAKQIAYGHQEKWDGSGYPEGDSGDDIPIPARLMAVADVYDALISRRVYKDGMPHEKAVGIILDGSGSHFDPDVVDAFMEAAEEFRQIALRYADSDTDMKRKADYLSSAAG
jgi:putative two-component system response regulator